MALRAEATIENVTGFIVDKKAAFILASDVDFTPRR
jgi:hypothetical protein